MPPTKNDVKVIHTLKSKLQYSDDTYRDILADRYKKDSSLSLSQRQSKDLIRHFRMQINKQDPSKNKKFGRTYPKNFQRKVQAIWISLEKADVIKKRGDGSLNKWVRSMTKRDDLRFCDYMDCSVLIEALKSWAKREDVALD